MLTGGKSGGELAAVVAHIGSGVRGEAIRHIELSGGSGEARESAVIGTHCAYGLLFREKYLDHEIVVRFETSVALPNVHGRSADLAFALALVASWCGTDGVNVFNFPPLAATGKLADDGGILSIGELEAKLAIALAALPENSLIFFPRANEADVTEELRRTASQRKITLAACDRLEEALQQLNITLSRSWLESPFRGLEPFEFAHASIFFGREAEIQAVLALLQRRITQGRRAILIEGPSGNGKSSLVLAGVLPALELSENEQRVLDTLRKDDDTSIDEVIRKSGLPSSAVSVALLSLEMKRVVKQLPGKLFVRNR